MRNNSHSVKSQVHRKEFLSLRVLTASTKVVMCAMYTIRGNPPISDSQLKQACLHYCNQKLALAHEVAMPVVRSPGL